MIICGEHTKRGWRLRVDQAHRVATRETLELVRAYYRIRDPNVRKALHLMTRALAKGAGSR